MPNIKKIECALLTWSKVLCLIIFLTNCSRLYFVREQTKENVSELTLGMAKTEVTSIMGTETLTVEHYDYTTPYRIEELKDSSENNFDVWFYYTDVKFQEGEITDDELIPVIFEKDTIVAIGWEYLK